MKKIILMLLISVLLAGFNYNVFAADGVTLKVNGSVVNYTPAPYIDPNTNRTLVPLRVISEKLGAKVDWDGEFKIVTVKLRGTEITIKIGNTFAYKNDQKKTLDQPAVIKQDRTFVPLRFVSESLDATVDWDEKNKIVSITIPTIPEGAFIEPKLEVKYSEGDFDNNYFYIILANHEWYPLGQYEIKTHIDNYPFNKLEFPLADKWYTGTSDGWYEVYPDYGECYSLPKTYYATREDMKKIPITDGMQIQYTVSLKQLSTGTIKDYKGTAVIKLK